MFDADPMQLDLSLIIRGRGRADTRAAAMCLTTFATPRSTPLICWMSPSWWAAARLDQTAVGARICGYTPPYHTPYI